MHGAAEGSRGGGTHAAANSAPVHPGRITVTERALTRAAEAIAADTLGVGRKDLTVSLAAARGGLALQVETLLSVPDLDDDAAVDAAGSILDRLASAQATIRDRAEEVLGRRVVRVNIRISGAQVGERRRVQ
jgi:hypothetical protein